MSEDTKLNLSEHVETLFTGVEGVTDEQKTKMETVLEAAVTSIVAEERAKLEEDFESKVDTAVEERATALEETVSKYMDYAVSEYMEENKIAIESGLKLEMATNFMQGMKDLFVEHNVEVPAGAEDLVASHEAMITDLEAKLNESTDKVIELTNQLDDTARGDIVAVVSEGLTDTQKEKFNSLVEGLEASNLEVYKTKVETIRESYFKAGKTEESSDSKTSLTEEAGSESDDPVAARQRALLNPYG